MPHVALVSFTGLRVVSKPLLELGMTLPGLQRRADALIELPSLGLLTLAGLNPPQWKCSYHEPNEYHDDLLETILSEKPTLVAMGALTASIEQAYLLSDALQKANVPVVLGGLHVTSCPHEAMQHCDAVVIGEGEPVWQTVLEDAEQSQLQPSYRAEKPFDLGQAPIPRYDLLGDRQRQRMTLQTERGCPFVCEFCGASRLLGKFREKPIEQIQKELDALTAHAPKPWLELADDNTFAGQRNPQELFDVLEAAKARYFTEADWRIGENPEILSGLAASGCVQVLIGIESLVFRYPGMGTKQAELKRVIAAIEAIQNTGVAVNGCVIVGADGETEQSLDRLIEFLLNSPFAEVQITLQTPFPGTGLRDRLQKEGRLIENRGWSYYTLFDLTYRPDCMRVEELEAGFYRVMKNVFSPEASARREQIRKKIWRRHPRFRS